VTSRMKRAPGGGYNRYEVIWMLKVILLKFSPAANGISQITVAARTNTRVMRLNLIRGMDFCQPLFCLCRPVWRKRPLQAG
jgi:hypothetical protein